MISPQGRWLADQRTPKRSWSLAFKIFEHNQICYFRFSRNRDDDCCFRTGFNDGESSATTPIEPSPSLISPTPSTQLLMAMFPQLPRFHVVLASASDRTSRRLLTRIYSKLISSVPNDTLGPRSCTCRSCVRCVYLAAMVAGADVEDSVFPNCKVYALLYSPDIDFAVHLSGSSLTMLRAMI